LFERLESTVSRYRELEELLGRPETAQQPGRLREVATELAGIRERVESYESWKRVGAALADSQELLRDDDADIRELAREEVAQHELELREIEGRLRRMLIPRDPNATRRPCSRPTCSASTSATQNGVTTRWSCSLRPRPMRAVTRRSRSRSAERGSTGTSSTRAACTAYSASP